MHALSRASGSLALRRAFALVLVGTTARAEPTVDPSEPTADEKLATPITMPRCPGVRIVEWRASRFLRDLTKATPEGTTVLEDACATALARHAAFLDSRNMTFVRQPIAARAHASEHAARRQGAPKPERQGRALSDCAPGVLCVGDLQRGDERVFLRNDPILRGPSASSRAVANRHFKRTARSEMAHLLNDQWQVSAKNDLGDARDEAEELAEEWVGYLGIMFPTESSEESSAIFARELRRHDPRTATDGDTRAAR